MKKLLIFALWLLLAGCAQAQWLNVVGSKTVSGTPTAATPTFSPVAGAITSGTTIAITSSTSGVTICYTLDSSTPTATTPGTCSHGTSISNGGSTSAITSALTVEAIATKASYVNSSVASAAYTIGSSGCSPTTYVDMFNRNATNLGTNWTQNTGPDDGWVTATPGTATEGDDFENGSIAIYSAGTWSDANQCAQLTAVNIATASTDVEPVVRKSLSPGNSYGLDDDGYLGQASIYLNDLFVLTSCSAGGNGDVVYISVQGTTITGNINGSLCATVTDSTVASGSAGMEAGFQECINGNDNATANGIVESWGGGTN